MNPFFRIACLSILYLPGLAACDRDRHTAVSASVPKVVPVRTVPIPSRPPSRRADHAYQLGWDLFDCAIRGASTAGSASVGMPSSDCVEAGAAAKDHATALFRQAAAEGNRDAEATLLGQQADAILDRLATRSGDGTMPSLSDEERVQMDQIVTGLEQQAFNGNVLALGRLQQIMGSSVFESNQPEYAAALRLVAEQPIGQSLRADASLKNESMLDDMDASEERRVIALARDIHYACCSR